MEVDCRKYTARIFTSENVDGNGVVVSNYLIIAVHVLDGSKSFEVWLGDRYFKIYTQSSIFFMKPELNENGDFLDLALYKLEELQSPIGFLTVM